MSGMIMQAALRGVELLADYRDPAWIGALPNRFPRFTRIGRHLVCTVREQYDELRVLAFAQRIILPSSYDEPALLPLEVSDHERGLIDRILFS